MEEIFFKVKIKKRLIKSTAQHSFGAY